MPAIRTNAAAAMLGISSSTLRSWERRFGFPAPQRSSGGHRQYDLGQIEALRAALEDTHNVSSAIAVARERGVGPSTPQRLRSALTRFDDDGASRVLEESMATRSVERTIDEVLLPALSAMAGDSAEYGFGWRWATGWLAAQSRLAPSATRAEGVLLFDATIPVDIDALYVQALELALRRSGARVLSLAVTMDPTRLAHALHALQPTVVILAGRGASRDVFGRLVFAARRQGGDAVALLDYRGALGGAASTVERLDDAPLAARELVLAHLEAPGASTGRISRAS